MWLLDDTTREIIDSLKDKKKVRELELRKKLKIRESEIRKVFYRLQEHGILYPIRGLTSGTKYDYEWGVRVNDLYKIYKILIDKEVKKLEERLKQEPDVFYVCENCGVSLDFDSADDLDYKCPECGSILVPKPNFRKQNIKELIHKLYSLLESYAPKKSKVIKAKQTI